MAQVDLGKGCPDEHVEGCIRGQMLTSTAQGCFRESDADLRQNYVVGIMYVHDGSGGWGYLVLSF